jgi:hypothetical protein
MRRPAEPSSSRRRFLKTAVTAPAVLLAPQPTSAAPPSPDRARAERLVAEYGGEFGRVRALPRGR